VSVVVAMTDSSTSGSVETVELPKDAVQSVIKALETGMRNGETAHEHDEIRPSSVMMAKAHKDAYQALIGAHPDYELQTGSDQSGGSS
jgi:hypothetical protein